MNDTFLIYYIHTYLTNNKQPTTTKAARARTRARQSILI